MNEDPRSAEIFDLEEYRQQVRQATGGNGPPGGGKNWLAAMAHGTRFIAKEIGKPGSELDDFVVSTPPQAFGDVVLLAKNIKGRDGVFEWHDPKIFSRDYKLYIILEVVELNGSNKSVQSERVDSHEDAEEQSGLHEDK